MKRAWIRHGLLGVTVALGAAGVFGSLRTGDLPGNGDSWGVAAEFIGYALLGWAVTGRRPELPIGWLLLAGGSVGTATFLATWWASQTLVNDPGSLPGGPFAAWLALWASALPWPLVLVAPLVLFPTGHTRTRRWFRFASVCGAIIGILTTVAAIVSLPVAARHAVELLDAPGITGTRAAEFAIGLPAIARLITFVATLISLIGLTVARKGVQGDDRRPYNTVLAGAAILVARFLVDALIPVIFGQQYASPEAVGALVGLVLPASIAIAVVRFQLYDLRTLVSRSVLVALTGLTLAAVYLGVLTLLAAVVGDSSPLTVPGILAAGAVVLVSAPVAASVTRTTRGWFGRRSPPAAMATRFAEQVLVDDDPLATAGALAETMRTELRLGSIELVIEGLGSTSLGEPSGPVTHVELRYGRRHVGEVLVTARQGEAFGEADVRTLREIAGYVSIAAEAIRIGEDLRRAQHDLENAQSEERRRVRRDLHDDVGPTLASARLKLAAHRRHLPEGTNVDDIIDQLADAISGVRRVVDGLQPSVLEDVGLVSALQILLTDLRQTSGMHITFDPPATLPDLPAATASTAYRVVAEALTNVVRHSGATQCTLRVNHDDGMLRVEVADNGHGFDTSNKAGMGLRNMADRAGLANGVATICSSPGSGTTVALDVPL
jgi:two-component system, NarL family, sensor kinase